MTAYGNAYEHTRTHHPAPSRSRPRCDCGCRTRATHTGHANGVALMSGCRWAVRQWVRDPTAGTREPGR